MSDDPIFNSKFVQILEKYPCIYDFTRKDHSRRDAIEKAWKAIEAEVKLPVVQCKEKWKNLRTAFSRSIKVPRSGSGATKKTYYLKDVMQFVLPFVKSKPQSGNLLYVEEMTETEFITGNSNEALDSDPNDTLIFQSADDPLSVDEIENVQNVVLSPLETKKTTEIQTKNVKKRSSLSTNEADKCFIEYVNWKKAKTTVPENSNPKLDFLRSLLPDLDQMNDYQLRQFKKRTLDTIDLILCDAPQSPQILSRPGSALSGQSYATEHKSLTNQEMRPQETYAERPLQSYLLNFAAQLPD